MNLLELADPATETIRLSETIRSGASVSTDCIRIRQIHSAISRTVADMNLVPGFTQVVLDRVYAGWYCHLVTFLFSQLPGPKSIVIDRMKDEVQRVYSTLLTRVHRRPKTASVDELPVLIGAIDVPAHKRDRSTSPSVRCNGGLHCHALVLLPPITRLNGSLIDHFECHQSTYVRRDKSIERVNIRPVENNHGRVVDYVLKTILKGRLSYDEAMIVLPRARAELD